MTGALISPPVQSVQCATATLAHMACTAMKSLYIPESKGLGRVRIPLSPPIILFYAFDFSISRFSTPLQADRADESLCRAPRDSGARTAVSW